MTLASMDYSPLLGMSNFNKKQALWLGGIAFVHGLSTEVARRWKTTTSGDSDT